MSKRKRNKEDGTKNNVKFKYKGVSKNRKKFMAQITIDGKTRSFGTFDTAKEAAQAHDLARIQLGHPTSKLNFLDQVPKFYKPKKQKTGGPKNTSGFKGVYKMRNRFQAQIYIGGKLQYFGTFGTAKEAAEAYDQAVLSKKKFKDPS